MSWYRLERGTDDSADDNASAAANDMDTLSLARSKQTTGSRAHFDLDLPSASADDLPLGPGTKTPNGLGAATNCGPDYCALQCVVARLENPIAPQRASASHGAPRAPTLWRFARRTPRWHKAQVSGDEIDIDAWVRFQSEACGGNIDSDTPPGVRPSSTDRTQLGNPAAGGFFAVYITLTQRQTPAVIDVIREALYVFGFSALSGTG